MEQRNINGDKQQSFVFISKRDPWDLIQLVMDWIENIHTYLYCYTEKLNF